MRNPVSSYKHYPWLRAVSSLALPILAAATLAAGVPPEGQLPGTPSPELARLFTPRNAPDGAYRVNVMRESIDAARRVVMAAVGAGPVPAGPKDEEPAWGPAVKPWQIVRMDCLQAFGTGGPYDASRLARLYWGRPALVVRGPIERDGRTVAAVTLISPYPDKSLSRLEEGTMIILLTLSPGQ